MSSYGPVPKASRVTSLTALPSPPLLGLAVMGLLSGCGDEAASSELVTSRKTVASFDEDAFAKECAERGDVIQTHPHCGGFNSCKGVSYDRTIMELTEHTCKGANTCAGVTCVKLTEEGEQEGKVTFAASCAGCHDDDGKFRLMIGPDRDAAAAKARFESVDEDRLVESVAFGVPRTDPDTSYPDMPAQYETLSRKEIVGVIAYARSLPLVIDASGKDPSR